MIVSKIQADFGQQNITNHCKPITNPQILASQTKLPNGIDAKSLVNISFRGVNDDLIAAVDYEYASYARLKKAIDCGADVNYSQRPAIVELMTCVNDENKFKCIEELLSVKTLNINKKDDYGYTALIQACCYNSTKTVELLLSHPNINLNLQNNENKTALMKACGNEEKRNAEIIELLLNRPDIDVNIRSNTRKTALHYACENQHAKATQLLVNHPEIDINAVNSKGWTALTYACEEGYTNIVRELLKHPDVDLNIKHEGKTAKEIAYQYGYRGIYKMIDEYQPGVDRREGVGVNMRKAPVDITKLSPEENIWTKEEISKKFMNLVRAKKYEDAARMLEITPLIDLDINNKEILYGVMKTNDPIFAEKVFDYKLLKQAQIQEEYNTRRKEFIERTIKTLSYDELKSNNIALNTVDGFMILIENPQFNPNDKAENNTLFERACTLDPEGNLAKEILSKYGDVNTADAVKTRNQAIKDLIENYEKCGKYKFVLNSIENNAFYADERRGIAANQLKELLESPNFTPEIADEVGNSVLHIAAALPDDIGRTLIQMALDKGVYINAGNCTGQRPLMSAIKKLIITEDNAGKMNLMSNIKFLLDKGADINAQDNNGQTAFHFACISTVAALLTLLLSKNPNVFLLDKHGNRAAKYLKTDEMREIYKEYINRAL